MPDRLTPEQLMSHQLDVAWTALADGTRRSIIRRLADGPLAVSALAAELPVTRSNLCCGWLRAHEYCAAAACCRSKKFG